MKSFTSTGMLHRPYGPEAAQYQLGFSSPTAILDRLERGQSIRASFSNRLAARYWISSCASSNLAERLTSTDRRGHPKLDSVLPTASIKEHKIGYEDVKAGKTASLENQRVDVGNFHYFLGRLRGFLVRFLS